MAEQVVNFTNQGAWASGTIVAAGTSTATTLVNANCTPMPFTITIKSSNAARAIQLSTDGGVEYFTPTYDQSTATMKVVTVAAPVSNVAITGVNDDTWSIR